MHKKETIKADLGTKRKFALIVCGLCVTGLLFIIMVNYFAEKVQFGLDRGQVDLFMVVFKGIVILLFFGLMFFVVTLFRKALKVIKCGQFPPPGEKMLLDTVIIKGDAAVKRAYLLMVFAAIIFFFSLVFTWVCWSFTSMLA